MRIFSLDVSAFKLSAIPRNSKVVILTLVAFVKSHNTVSVCLPPMYSAACMMISLAVTSPVILKMVQFSLVSMEIIVFLSARGAQPS